MLHLIQHLNFNTVNPVLMKPMDDENLSLAEKVYNPLPLLFSCGPVLLYLLYTLHLLAIQHHTVTLC